MSLHELRKNNYEKVAKENPDSVDGQDTERTSFFWFLYGGFIREREGKEKTQSHVYDSAFLTTHQKMSQLLFSKMIQKRSQIPLPSTYLDSSSLFYVR